MKNMLIKVLAVSMLLMLALISCSGDKATGGKVTLEWWQFWTDPAIKPTMEKLVADYETAHPEVNVNINDLTWANGHEKIVIAFSSNTAPDIIELGSDWVPEFSSSSQLADITEFFSTDSGLYHGWSPGIWQEKIYAAPWILGTRVLFINKELMLKAGYDENYAPVNFTQMKELCYRIDSLGEKVYGFGSNAAEKHRLYKKWMPFFWSNDGRIVSRDGKYSVISSDRAFKALSFYKDLNDNCSLVDTQRRLEDAFLEGKVGVVISGDWLLKRINNEGHAIDFLTSLIPGPVYPGKSFLGGEYLAVSQQCENKKEAVAFIKYLTSKESQLQFCKANFSMNPSNKEAATDPYFSEIPNRKTFTQQIRMSVAPPAVPEWVYIEDVIETTLEKVLFNDAPIAGSLYEAKFKIADILKLEQ